MKSSLLAAGIWFAAAGLVHAQDTRHIEHQGVARPYMVVNKSPDIPKPTLILLHGLRPADAALTSFAPVDALAAREDFVAVYPGAYRGSWNYSAQLPRFNTRIGDTTVDDVGFIRTLIETLVNERVSDPSRIYVSGSSQGGFLTYSLLCELDDKVAAVVALIANMTELQISACKPQRRVPTMVVAGTNDRIVPYDGWIAYGSRMTSIPETLEFWRKHHRCDGQKATSLPRRNEQNPTRAQLIEWTGCETEGALRLYRIDSGGHNSPSITAPQPESRFGLRNEDFETSEEVWRFVSRFKL